MLPTAMSRPDGPAGHPLWGSLSSFIEDPAEFLAQQVRDYGGLCSFRLLHSRVYLVSDPELVRTVLVSDAKNYLKDKVSTDVMKQGLGDGLVTSGGQFHTNQRKLVQPAFQHKRVTNYGAIFSKHSELMLSKWQNGETREFKNEMHRLTMAIATESLFGAKLSDDDYSVGTAISRLQELAIRSLTAAYRFPVWLPTPLNRAVRRERKALDRVVNNIISARRSDPSDKGDLLSALLVSCDSETPAMSNDQLRDEVITLFAAGHETTANALTWVFSLLSDHPNIQARLHAELDQVLDGRTVSVDDLDKLTFASAIFTETLRLKPTVWMLNARESVSESKLGGYVIPKRARIFISPYAMHRNTEYFDNPEDFDPDRWLDGRTSSLHRLAYMPFGAGHRVCIGNQFALQEGVMVMVAIAQLFSVQKASNEPLRKRALITLTPDGDVPMIITSRAARAS